MCNLCSVSVKRLTNLRQWSKVEVMGSRSKEQATATQRMSPAPGYSIRVVSAQTGIPAETLRMWERRYGFPSPARRPGGGRLYADEDVMRLRLIARARHAGYRPGDVIALPNHEIVRLVEAESPSSSSTSSSTSTSTDDVDLSEVATPLVRPAISPDLDEMIDLLRRDDVPGLRALMRSLAIALGPKAFVMDVAHPFAVKVGDAWRSGKIDVRHEHVATALMSMQLRLLLSAFEEGEDKPIVVLATLPGEAHALALEMVGVYLAARRASPRLLGADTPTDEIARAAIALRADVIGISISAAHDPAAARKHVTNLRAAIAKSRVCLWIGGAGAPQATTPEGDRVLLTTSWPSVDSALEASRAL